MMECIPDDMQYLRSQNWEHIDRKDKDYCELGMAKIIKAADERVEPEPEPEPEPKPLVAPQAVELQDLSIEVASRPEPEPDPNASVEVSKPSPEPALGTAAAATASAAPTFTVHCHGPYGAAPFSLPASEDAVLFYVGGIGITPAASCGPPLGSKAPKIAD